VLAVTPHGQLHELPVMYYTMCPFVVFEAAARSVCIEAKTDLVLCHVPITPDTFCLSEKGPGFTSRRSPMMFGRDFADGVINAKHPLCIVCRIKK